MRIPIEPSEMMFVRSSRRGDSYHVYASRLMTYIESSPVPDSAVSTHRSIPAVLVRGTVDVEHDDVARAWRHEVADRPMGVSGHVAIVWLDKEYSQYWNAILSGTGELILDETEETFANENEQF